jgi:hypothetical protein
MTWNTSYTNDEEWKAQHVKRIIKNRHQRNRLDPAKQFGPAITKSTNKQGGKDASS